MMVVVIIRQKVVRLTDVLSFALGHHIHRGDEPKGGITALHVEPGFRVNIVLDTVRTGGVCVLECIDTLENQWAFFLLAQNNTGHTREYAQHHDLYQRPASHECKSTLFFLLSQIFHQNFCIAAVAQFGNALFADLTDTLTGETQLVANLLETLLMATDAEALADDGYLTLLQYFIEYGVQFHGHRLMVDQFVRTCLVTRGHQYR